MLFFKENIKTDAFSSAMRIQEFQNYGAWSRFGRILGVWGLFWCLHTYPMFCSERRKQSTYCKHCMMATITVYACYTVKIYKYKPAKNFKQWGARPASRCWIRLWYLCCTGFWDPPGRCGGTWEGSSPYHWGKGGGGLPREKNSFTCLPLSKYL